MRNISRGLRSGLSGVQVQGNLGTHVTETGAWVGEF